VAEHGLKGGVLVGDGLDDFAAAQKAGFRFVLAKWGYGAQGVVEKHGSVDGMDGLEEIRFLL